MLPGVMAVDLPKDAPKFEATIECLMLRPHTSLNCEIFFGVAIIVKALDFGGVPSISIVGFDPLTWLE